MTTRFQAEGIIVLGAPHSGTTLLRRLLDAHSSIACPGETNVLTACGRFLRQESIAGGVGIGVIDGLGYAGFAREEVLTRLRELAFSLHRDYAARQGKARWASKTAFDAFYLAEIEALCGDQALFVCIQRHGLDVACSIQELCEKNGGYLQELHEYIVRHRMVLEAFAHVWVDLTRAIDGFSKRHRKNTITVKYEDLTSDPDATMNRIMSFVGESWSSRTTTEALVSRKGVGLGDWKTYGRASIDQSSVGRWKNLPRHTVARLAEICNATLELCGYERVHVDPEQNAKAARRRYEVGLLLQGLSGKRKSDGRSGRERKAKKKS